MYGIAAESTLWSAAGINAKTAQAYQALFQRMFKPVSPCARTRAYACSQDVTAATLTTARSDHLMIRVCT